MENINDNYRQKLKLWLWLTTKRQTNKNLNSVKLNRIYNYFKSIDAIFDADAIAYKKTGFLDDELINNLCDKSLDFDEIIDLYNENSVTMLSIDMPEYPKLLKQITNPPLLIYCRGKFVDLNERLCIAMVGTRKSTNYGETVAYNMAKELAENGAVIVSGMALGIDTCAHTGALDANMPTVAVIGCGVNLVYPKSNARLMKNIIKTGMVISEYPLNTEPERYHFPERNRIISGLTKGTLVIEADIKSGSLITAKYAYEQNRDVYAVPGNINSVFSKGTNYLIKDGAYPTTCADDVLYNYRENYEQLIINGLEDNKEPSKPKEKQAEKQEEMENSESNPELIEKKILEVLTDDAIHIDKICELTGLTVQEINSKILFMEMNKKVKKYPGNCYSLIKK